MKPKKIEETKKEWEKANEFRIRTQKEWDADYISLKTEGKKLWEIIGLPEDIRAGWQKAAKENKLFSFGPYSVPLDVVEAIEDDTKWMLDMAGIVRKPGVDSSYVQSLRDRVKELEGDLNTQYKQMDTLLGVIADLRAQIEKKSVKSEQGEEKEFLTRLRSSELEDYVELF